MAPCARLAALTYGGLHDAIKVRPLCVAHPVDDGVPCRNDGRMRSYGSFSRRLTRGEGTTSSGASFALRLQENGPWLIVAASFSGEGAEEQAQSLAQELRARPSSVGVCARDELQIR